MNRSDLDETFRDMWVTRPRRLSNDKKIAGVAAAIARRYRVDPTLIRVGFVIATVYGGLGLMLYVLGWLLLPSNEDEVSPAEAAIGRGRSSASVVLTWVAAIVLIPMFIGAVSNLPSMLASLAAIGAGLFLLHRHRGGAPGTAPLTSAGAFGVAAPAAPFTGPYPGPYGSPYGSPYGGPTVPIGATPYPTATYPTPAAATATAAPASAVTDQLPREDEPVTGPRPTDQIPDQPPGQPPAWDPLGVAPFAWDLPEPSAPEPPPPAPRAPKRRSPVTPITLGLAFVTAGVCAVVAPFDSYLDAGRVLAMVLAIVGTGLLVGAFVRGGRGLIPVAIPLALLTWGLTAVPAEYAQNGFGNREYVPQRVAEVQPEYLLGGGNFELDLTKLELTDTQRVRTRVEIGLGNAEVMVPANADVIATCSSRMGNVECLGREASGGNAEQRVTDYGEDGPGKGGRIELELVNTGSGNIEIFRG